MSRAPGEAVEMPAVPRIRPDGGPAAAVSDGARREYRRAWWSLACIPPSFVAAFAIGEGLFALLAGDADDPSVWAALVAGGIGMAVFALPGIAAVVFGRRAMRLGQPRGRLPAMVGGGLTVVFVAVNVVSWLVQLAGG